MPAELHETIPNLPAFRHPNGIHALVWCQHCDLFHLHGAAIMGHRVAHCVDMDSPYKRTGYTLIDAGPASKQLLDLHERRQEQQQ